MRTKLKHSILISILFLFLLILLPGFRAEAASVKIRLNKTSATLYMDGTKTVKLKATVTGSKKKVAWSSSDKKVATVNSSGKVTAQKAGTATITAKVEGKTAKCKIKVKKAAVTVKLDKSSLTLETGKTAKLKATVTGSSAKVTWSSSDKKVATVNSSGKVTAKKAGTATITAKVERKSVKCKVTVKEKADGGVPSIAKTYTTYWDRHDPQDPDLAEFGIVIPVKNLDVIYINELAYKKNLFLEEISWSNPIWDIESHSDENSILISGKTYGTPRPSETVTIRYKAIKDEKTYELSSKIIIKPVPDNILKSLKIGSKEYAQYFKNGITSVEVYEKPEEDARISVELAEGYKLIKIMNIYQKFFPYVNEIKEIKNGSTTASRYSSIEVVCRSERTGITYGYELDWGYYTDRYGS